jgi:hypothetical protein
MTETIITKLARHCQISVEGLKGKARDRAVIQYWNGAIGALHSVGYSDADWVSRVGHLLIASRGYREIENIIKKAEEANVAISQRGEDVQG